jgi:hypothetical protein
MASATPDPVSDPPGSAWTDAAIITFDPTTQTAPGNALSDRGELPRLPGALLRGDLDEPAQRVGQLHLARRPACDPHERW